ncbi:unnamed protein product [Sphagnum balticum]
MAWRKKALGLVGQVRGILITHCHDLNSQAIAAEFCNPMSWSQEALLPFAAAKATYLQRLASEGLRGILFSRTTKPFQQVLHSSQPACQRAGGVVVGSRIFRWNSDVGFEGFQAASNALSVASRRGFSSFRNTLPGTQNKVQQGVVRTAVWRNKLLQSQSSKSRFLPVLGKRNFNVATLTERFRSSTEKVKENLLKAKQGVKKVGATEAARSNELLSGIMKPVNSAKQTVMGFREALGLQVEAFWKRNYLVMVGAVAVFACLLLWRIMFGIASLFVGLSEGMAKFGFLALAAGMVTIGAVVTRARYMINPDAVYRIAMRKLNTSAAVLEVMGAPLTGTDVRAYVMSGGGLRFKNFRPRLSGKRCFLIFPITGGERRGLVSIEVKKKKGQYDFKLLAVDIPTAGAEHRVYLIGDEAEYRVGGGLISVLRDPIVKAMAAQKEFEERDEREHEEDIQRAWEAEEARAQERLDKLERDAAATAAASKTPKEELPNPEVVPQEREAMKA